ncbi:hypothetical protein LR48_Vigan05g065900 [Vigna angularis]|uniref:Uncharacterized protein n=1 Tax=Phaseolus angularis TaxID=3914 RepID=A0A0L9UJK6_PHAAN|nr:hypothetical protein LR48_Vigan05g065900 [Vigna angularis]
MYKINIIRQLNCDIRALTRAGSDAGARGMMQGAQTRSGSWQLRVEGGWTVQNTTGWKSGELDATLDLNEHGKGMDLCSINPNHLGKK